MRFLLAGGGSIGHVAPNVSVARALLEREPDAIVHLVCAHRPEEEAFLETENLPHTPLLLPGRAWTTPLKLLVGILRSLGILHRCKPDVVLCKGGGISVPVAVAARLRRIPLVLHESDAVIGQGTRILAQWARMVCLGMPSVADLPPAAARRALFTGNPVRPDVTQGSREEGLRITGFSGERPILLVTGGSQGARSINETVGALLDALTPLCDVIHLTGRGKLLGIERRGYWAREFVFRELPHLYACTSLSLSRAGAGTIAELAANGIPGILVPLRGLAQDHQHANARAAEASGGCVSLEQDVLPVRLVPLVHELLDDPSRLRTMGEHMRTLMRPDAAGAIADAMLTVARRG